MLMRIENYSASHRHGGGASGAEVDFLALEDSLILARTGYGINLGDNSIHLSMNRGNSLARVINYSYQLDGEQHTRISLHNLLDTPTGGKLLVAFDFPDPSPIQLGSTAEKLELAEAQLASVMDLFYGRYIEEFINQFGYQPYTAGTDSMAYNNMNYSLIDSRLFPCITFVGNK